MAEVLPRYPLVRVYFRSLTWIKKGGDGRTSSKYTYARQAGHSSRHT